MAMDEAALFTLLQEESVEETCQEILKQWQTSSNKSQLAYEEIKKGLYQRELLKLHYLWHY